MIGNSLYGEYGYPKVHALGHRDVADILEHGSVWIQEKIDGSQINFTWDMYGVLTVRSKNSVQFGGPENRVQSDNMFWPAVDYLRSLDVPRHLLGVTFSGETLSSLRHNKLTYERLPVGNILLFDASHPTLVTQGLGLDWVQDFGSIPALDVTKEFLDELLTKPSSLGGPMMEGVVLKNYDLGLVAKYVAPAFREVEKSKVFRNKGEVVADILTAVNTEPRFEKAVQYLAEEGQLTGTPSDIGPLMRRVSQDIWEEEYGFISDTLMDHYGKEVRRGLGRGLPDWYKNRLAESAFA